MYCVVPALTVKLLRKVRVHRHSTFTLDISISPGDSIPERQTGNGIVEGEEGVQGLCCFTGEAVSSKVTLVPGCWMQWQMRSGRCFWSMWLLDSLHWVFKQLHECCCTAPNIPSIVERTQARTYQPSVSLLLPIASISRVCSGHVYP